ncbi:DUF742 domain-containing protein [Streptomyces sp. RB6PN25]|uniref:DUF742 domain-containing protein n=1 Tax=Streptomyces humicola TaxID=2953240 RepID=A0ABT1PNA8_9ACTN|nr:DUF742 domain-containing protein [Streptomyces humicola]MCQ4079155.1 DUF742 domain-containing protein [Streptomyces humicola]
MPSGDDPWIDEDTGRLIRPYTLTGGRTRPRHQLNLLSLVRTTETGVRERLDPEHVQVLDVCSGPPVSVAEVAARLRQPVQVAKILLSDLIDVRAVTTRAPVTNADPTTRETLEAVLDGLQQLL